MVLEDTVFSAEAVGEIPQNQAGRPTVAELERRKATVMEVATQLFISQGYAETSLVDIAKRAGVATRTLYQHFGDKEAIFREVIFARRAAPMMPPSTPAPDATLLEALQHEASELLAYALDPRSVDLMRLMVAESRRFPDLIKKVANATFARVLANICHIFEVLEERRQIPAGDHEQTARIFLDLVLGSTPIMVYTNWLSELPGEAEIRQRVEMFIIGRFGPKVAREAAAKRPRPVKTKPRKAAFTAT